MLVVKVEVHPDGDPLRARQIARINIGNQGGPEDACRYIVACHRDGVVQQAECVHDRSDGALVLIAKALAAIGIRA